MWILLVAVFLIPFVFFGYLTSNLDKFLVENANRIDIDKLSPVAIVFGRTDLAKQIIELLEGEGVRVIPLIEPFYLKKEKYLRYIFALSDNDADNIVLSKIGKKVYSIEEMISICNDRRNEAMFIREKIHYLLIEGATVQMIYQAVLQGVEVNS